MMICVKALKRFDQPSSRFAIGTVFPKEPNDLRFSGEAAAICFAFQLAVAAASPAASAG
jgi:hypothetical protein